MLCYLYKVMGVRDVWHVAREMIVGHWTYTLESGPLICAPAAPKLAGG